MFSVANVFNVPSAFRVFGVIIECFARSCVFNVYHVSNVFRMIKVIKVLYIGRRVVEHYPAPAAGGSAKSRPRFSPLQPSRVASVISPYSAARFQGLIVFLVGGQLRGWR